ncbi:MAG TPA: DUF222 domain-containing protein [Pseudonocardiaceae bacterium]
MFEGDEIIDAAQHWECVIAHAQAQQLKAFAALAELRRRPHGQIDEHTADELALALSISGVAAHHRLDLALTLTHRRPATLAALEAGQIDLLRARAIADGTGPLSAEQAAQVEARVLAKAGEQTAPQVRQAIKRAVLTVDPGGEQDRHRRHRQQRRVVLGPDEHGMASLWAYLPAHQAIAVYATLQHRARQAITPDDERTADQRRADALVDLVLDPTSCPNRPPIAQVNVTVPASSLLALDQQPGELAGYGPIPADLAREIAADATWRRLLTDPVSGALLDYGRTRYKPPAALADFVRARDATCTFPGCRRAAHRCELDHEIAYPDGPTSADNLDPKCPHHHRTRHHPDWHYERLDNGDHLWITPTGRHYVTHPEPIAEPIPQSVMVDVDEPDPPPF